MTSAAPPSCSSESDWPSAPHPIAVATTGLSSARNVIADAGSAVTPRNQSACASAVPASPIRAKPSRLPPVGTGGTPSTSAASGATTRPPITSCQAVSASNGSGGLPQRRPSTVATAIDAAAPTAAATPIPSSDAVGPSTSAATPTTPRTPAPSAARAGLRPRIGQPKSSTMIGATAPAAAATPPGRRSAEMKSSTKKSPMLRRPRAAMRSRHPAGGRPLVRATRRRPAGSARPAAASSGRPGGSSSVTIQ